MKCVKETEYKWIKSLQVSEAGRLQESRKNMVRGSGGMHTLEWPSGPQPGPALIIGEN